LDFKELEDLLDNPKPKYGYQEIDMGEETHKHEELLVEYGT